MIDRFVAAGLDAGFITTGRRQQSARSGRDAVEFVAHTCLEFRSGGDSIFIDPCFYLPTGRPEATRIAARRFERKLAALTQASAIVITHHHWDHCHLPTLLRVPRNTPIFIPRVRKETLHNPSIKNALLSLGFTDLREVTYWKREAIGSIAFTPIPFFGEWFGPNSEFDAFCYLIEVGGRTYLGTADADRDDRGNMVDVFRTLRDRAPRIDYMFFGSSAQRHLAPNFAGAPARISNTFASKYRAQMRYHPNVRSVERWCKLLEPRVIVPYAEFIFVSEKVRPPFAIGAQLPYKKIFRDYWEANRHLLSDDAVAWRDDLARLMRDLSSGPTRLLMLGPGEGLAPPAS